MNLTCSEITRVIAELHDAIEGAYLNKILQTDQFEWVFTFRKDDTKSNLLVSLSPSNSRIHLITATPEQGRELGSFGKLLKKTVSRQILSEIKQVNNDRVVKMDFDWREIKWTLFLELMGTAGNIYLLDNNGKVAAIALPRKSRNTTGQTYTLPPPRVLSNDTAAVEKAQSDDTPFAFNRRIESQYTQEVSKEKLDHAKSEASAPLLKQIKKTRKRIKELEKQKETLANYSEYKIIGDILRSNYHKIRKGSKKVSATDYRAPDSGQIEIPVDPALSPADNVNRYYKLHRKYLKGLPRIDADLTKLTTKNDELKRLVSTIRSADSTAAVAPHLPAGQKSLAAAKPKTPKNKSGPKQFISSEGYVILAGRSDRENDEITFRIANGRDLWLHARDYPGSHVLVKLPKGLKQIPQVTLKEAAMIALKYSKAAKAMKGEVTYTLVKNVRKFKGAAPGKVIVTGDKSIMAKIEPVTIEEMKTRTV